LLHPDFTIDANANILTNSLLQYDTQTGTSNTLLTIGSTENDYRYGNPLLSPDGKLLALSMRTIRREVARLWVVETDKLEEPIMTTGDGYTYDSYQWDMQGRNLLIQQSSISRAYWYEVAVWNASQGYRVVATNATSPHWLP
jgi:dipeptidyl aminopeptidase/acylaminoacyl peptidase